MQFCGSRKVEISEFHSLQPIRSYFWFWDLQNATNLHSVSLFWLKLCIWGMLIFHCEFHASAWSSPAGWMDTRETVRPDPYSSPSKTNWFSLSYHIWRNTHYRCWESLFPYRGAWIRASLACTSTQKCTISIQQNWLITFTSFCRLLLWGRVVS